MNRGPRAQLDLRIVGNASLEARFVSVEEYHCTESGRGFWIDTAGETENRAVFSAPRLIGEDLQLLLIDFAGIFPSSHTSSKPSRANMNP